MQSSCLSADNDTPSINNHPLLVASTPSYVPKCSS